MSVSGFRGHAAGKVGHSVEDKVEHMRLPSIIVTTALGLTLLQACGGSSSSEAGSDIRVTTCAADPAGGRPKASGTIVNNSSKPSAYTFEVRFLDPSGNIVSQTPNAVGRVEPGGTADWNVEGIARANGPLNCQVASPSRAAVGS